MMKKFILKELEKLNQEQLIAIILDCYETNVELSKKFYERGSLLIDYLDNIYKLEKALDKACSHLRLCAEYGFSVEECFLTVEQWKEWCMSDGTPKDE